MSRPFTGKLWRALSDGTISFMRESFNVLSFLFQNPRTCWRIKVISSNWYREDFSHWDSERLIYTSPQSSQMNDNFSIKVIERNHHDSLSNDPGLILSPSNFTQSLSWRVRLRSCCLGMSVINRLTAERNWRLNGDGVSCATWSLGRYLGCGLDTGV
jgi:hypothetical protein